MAPPNPPFKVLVFSKTAGFRHDSIPAGIAALRRLAETSQTSGSPFVVDASEEASLFTSESLSRYRVVVLLQASGEFLTSDQLKAFQGFVRAGGGVVGVHCASTGMPSSDWYGRLMGGVFTEHPEPQSGEVIIEDPSHVILSNGTGLHGVGSDKDETGASRWKWYDEWYNFEANPRTENGVHVLLKVKESSYKGGTLGEDHPIAWCQEFEGARSFYTALGHFDEAYEDEALIGQILNGIWWTARLL